MNNEGVQPIRELRWSRRLSYTDSGSYLCRAENDNGTDNATLDLLVRCKLVFRAGLRAAIGQHVEWEQTLRQTSRHSDRHPDRHSDRHPDRHSDRHSTDTQTDTQTDKQTLRQTLRQTGG